MEDRKGQEEIFVHAEKDVNVHVKNDWKEHVLRDQHRTIDHFSYSLVKGEDQQTVEKDRKVELLSDDHLTVRGSSHSRYGNDWLLHAGTESHVAAGRKTVIEAGSELTIKAGGGFIRIDPSGVYVGGTTVRINSGGSPGSGNGARPQLPIPPEYVGKYTEHFVLQDNEGRFWVNMPYEILLEGDEIVSGMTDMQGRTHVEVDKCVKEIRLGLSSVFNADLE